MKLQHDFLKMRGGSKAVWNFSENSSVMETPPVPNLGHKGDKKPGRSGEEREKRDQAVQTLVRWRSF